MLVSLIIKIITDKNLILVHYYIKMWYESFVTQLWNYMSLKQYVQYTQDLAAIRQYLFLKKLFTCRDEEGD